eukprot:scaffold16368_cov73-Cyclotella_meneghiniana.AAC.9
MEVLAAWTLRGNGAVMGRGMVPLLGSSQLKWGVGGRGSQSALQIPDSENFSRATLLEGLSALAGKQSAEPRAASQGLLPEIYSTPDTRVKCLRARSDKVYRTTYTNSRVPGGRYPNTYPSTRSKLGYHRWVACHFSKWRICSPS